MLHAYKSGLTSRPMDLGFCTRAVCSCMLLMTFSDISPLKTYDTQLPFYWVNYIKLMQTTI